MIKVTRTAEPSILAKNKNIWLSDYLKAQKAYNLTPSDANKKKKDNAEKKYNHKKVKEELKTMFSGKCAYCESAITHIDYGHIEHFKPKNIYENLCFEWDNLLLACGVCNGKEYKGEKFPSDTAGNDLFVNPTTENPDDFFDFEYDVNTNTANVIYKNIKGETTVREIGLNRTDLVKRRSEIVRNIVFITIKAAEGDLEALAIIKKSIDNKSQYSAFTKTLVKRYELDLSRP